MDSADLENKPYLCSIYEYVMKNSFSNRKILIHRNTLIRNKLKIKLNKCSLQIEIKAVLQKLSN